MSDVKPHRIGPYVLGEPLPGGTAAEVRQARDEQGRRVVVKLHARGEGEAGGLAELELLGLSHPGLGVCLDGGRLPGDGRLYTVTEHVDGVPLAAGTLADGTDDERTLVAARLLAALAVLHAHGFLHRDVKPDNVLLEGSVGRPVLIDFGLACPVSEAPGRSLAGTPRTMAPELFAGGTASVASDLWAAGLVLTEAILGRRLFDGDDPATLAAAHGAHRGFASDVRDALGSPELVALLERLLDSEPGGRPESAAAALAALPIEPGTARDALYADELAGERTAALAAADPRVAAVKAAARAGRVRLDLLPRPDTSLSAALSRLVALAASMPSPPESLRLRIDAASSRPRTRPQDFAVLAEGLATRGPLVVRVGETSAREWDAVADALDGVAGVTVERGMPPGAAACRDALRRWLGQRPALERRLEAAPPATWDELDEALAELLRCGAVSRGPGGIAIHESVLPAPWPGAGGEDPRARLSPTSVELLDLLALCPRPLSGGELATVLGDEPQDALATLAARRLATQVRSGAEVLVSVADDRLRRTLLVDADVSVPRRVRLAHVLTAGDQEPDEELAASFADVLGVPAGADDPALTESARRCAETLRRVGRLDLASGLLRRALEGCPLAEPRRHAVRVQLVDVLIRRNLWDAAQAEIAAGRAEGVDEGALLVREARVLGLTGRHGQAVDLLRDVEELTGPDSVLGLQTRAVSRGELGRADEALADLREALRRQGTRPDTRTLGLLETLGRMHGRRGEFDEAVRRYEQVLAMGRELGQEALLASPLNNLARVVRARGERRRGLQLQQQAADLCEAVGNRQGLATMLNGLGAGWLTLGRVDRARHHLVRAQRLADELGDDALMAMVLNNLGRSLAAEGRHAEAEERFEESLALRARLDDRRGQAAVALTRGPLRLTRGELEGARADLERATGLLEGLIAPDWEVERDLLAARIHLAAGRHELAVAAAQAARELAETRQLGRERLVALDLLGRAGSLSDAELEPQGEPGPWLADLLFTRAERRAAMGDLARAHADIDRGLSILGDSPEGSVECRGLLLRTRLDLPCLEELLLEAHPDYARAGEFLSRVERDTERARALVDAHGLLPQETELQQLTERYEALPMGEDMTGLSAMAERLRNLERLAEINKLLNTERDTQKLLDLIIDSAVELTGAARGFLILFDGRAQEFRAARNIDESTIRDPQFQVSQSVARGVVRTGKPLLTANAIDDERLESAASISELRLLSILCVPLVSQQRTIGAVYVDHPQVVGRFDDGHLQMVTSLAEQAAIALENARLSQGLEESNQELVDSKEEVARLNEALEDRLHQREAELERARESLDASRRALALRYDYSRIITRSPRMLEVLDLLDRVTDTHFPVVIYGESGTGKELIARALHFNGPRRESNFLSINCAAIAEPLIESELFGSVRGAFTGADRDRKGLFEQANQGTLFLDEIGDMNLNVQKRLLRVLQEGEFLPVGGREVRKVDVRILCATHRDLKSMVAEQTFREDLYYRLAVARVDLPALRERIEDVAVLLPHFLEQHGGGPRQIEPEALALLESRPWPGNVRELENLAMNLVLFDARGNQVTADLVRRVLGEAEAPGRSGPSLLDEQNGLPLKARLESFERRQVAEALAASGGNKSQAARQLGVGIRSFYKMLDRLGLS